MKNIKLGLLFILSITIPSMLFIQASRIEDSKETINRHIKTSDSLRLVIAQMNSIRDPFCYKTALKLIYSKAHLQVIANPPKENEDVINVVVRKCKFDTLYVLRSELTKDDAECILRIAEKYK